MKRILTFSVAIIFMLMAFDVGLGMDGPPTIQKTSIHVSKAIANPATAYCNVTEQNQSQNAVQKKPLLRSEILFEPGCTVASGVHTFKVYSNDPNKEVNKIEKRCRSSDI